MPVEVRGHIASARPAVAASLAQRLFRACLTPPPIFCLAATVTLGRPRLPALGDPVVQLGGVEVRVAAVDHGGWRTVLELQVGDVVPLGRPCLLPGSGHRADASYPPAADEPEAVDL